MYETQRVVWEYVYLKTPLSLDTLLLITKSMSCFAERERAFKLHTHSSVLQRMFTALTLPLVLPGGSETVWRGSWHIPPQSLS